MGNIFWVLIMNKRERKPLVPNLQNLSHLDGKIFWFSLLLRGHQWVSTLKPPKGAIYCICALKRHPQGLFHLPSEGHFCCAFFQTSMTNWSDLLSDHLFFTVLQLYWKKKIPISMNHLPGSVVTMTWRKWNKWNRNWIYMKNNSMLLL